MHKTELEKSNAGDEYVLEKMEPSSPGSLHTVWSRFCLRLNLDVYHAFSRESPSQLHEWPNHSSHFVFAWSFCLQRRMARSKLNVGIIHESRPWLSIFLSMKTQSFYQRENFLGERKNEDGKRSREMVDVADDNKSQGLSFAGVRNNQNIATF